MRRGLALLIWGLGFLAATWTTAPPHAHRHTFTEAVGLAAPARAGSDAGAELLPAREHGAAACPACAMGPSAQAAPGHDTVLPEPCATAAVPPTAVLPPAIWLLPAPSARAPPVG